MSKTMTVVGKRLAAAPAAAQPRPARRCTDEKLAAVWFTAAQRPWSSLAVVPADASLSRTATRLAESLADLGEQHGERALHVIDATAARIEGVQDIVASLRLASESNSVIVSVDPIADNPTSKAILHDASLVIVVTQLGASGVSTARGIVTAIGKNKILGNILLGTGLTP